jgi:putative glutamine amidotransferase
MTVVGVACRRWTLPSGDQETVVGVWSDYVNALTAVGAGAVLIPFQEPDLALSAFERCDGLLLAGGEDVGDAQPSSDPEKALCHVDTKRDELEFLLLTRARQRMVPVLGICRGLQLLNIALGGTISRLDEAVSTPLRHITRWREGEVYVHDVTVMRESLLAALWSGAERIPVNGNHKHCAKAVGRGLRVSAHSSDGVIEAVEATDGAFCVGVQWHPECLVRCNDSLALSLFRAFVDACSRTSLDRPVRAEAESCEEGS